MTKFICIHAHFYQPPRQNPWSGVVEPESSAYPFSDWNQRIWHECYQPNLEARLLDEKGRVRRRLNNYARLSFNFGPTLLDWIAAQQPQGLASLVEADRESQARFGGHGSALAQAYSHAILPLCNKRDRLTQVRWGLLDFTRRFGRPAEAMWLPECAVDAASLETLVAEGMKFVILAPRQAARVRAPGGSWQEVDAASLDTTRPYRCELGNGSLTVFFYQGRLSQQVAFEGLLRNGDLLVARLLEAGREGGLVALATDGETYGHHHRFGDMALAYALERLERLPEVRLTNFAEYAEEHPPSWQVELRFPSSWSCLHGVERWRTDCGCSTGAHPGWNQSWRGPLRRAVDELADLLATEYEACSRGLVTDPWVARDESLPVLWPEATMSLADFFEPRVNRPLTEQELERLGKLLRAHFHAQLMQASCGWFFDDVFGLEAGIVMLQAARAMELVRQVSGRDFEPRFLEILEMARSNRAGVGTGADIFLSLRQARGLGPVLVENEE